MKVDGTEITFLVTTYADKLKRKAVLANEWSRKWVMIWKNGGT